MKPFALLLPLLLSAAACDNFPRDPERTLEQVRSERSFSVGLVAPLDEKADPKVAALLHAVGAATGATPELKRGDAEPLLNQLEQGEIDLVIGRFEKKSPWARLVTLGPPLEREKHGKVEFHLAPVMRNGENAWIALIEKAARDVAPEAQ